MKIDCVLKTWYKKKQENDNMWYYIPSYKVELYQHIPDVEFKYALQIIVVGNEDWFDKVLAENVFVPDGKSTRYVSFLNASYCYDEERKLIYTTQTERDI